MESFTFYTNLFNKLSDVLTTYITNVSTTLVGAIGPLAAQLLALYFIIHGIALMRGLIEEPISDFAVRVVKMSLILGCALSVGIYNGEIVSFIWNSPDALGALVAGGDYSDNNNVNFLDALMTKIYDLGHVYWSVDNAGPDIGTTFLALIIWLVGLILTGYGAFLFVLAKMALAILLALGPIFIMLLMFEATKRFFESWLGQAMNYVFMVVLVSAACKLILTIIDAYMGPALADARATASIPTAVPAIAYSVIGALVLMQLSSVASALGGGVAVSTLGAGAAVWSKATGAGRGVKNMATGKTLNDMRAARRQRETNKRWAKNNPGVGAKVAGLPMAAFKKVTATPNRVKQG